MSELREVFEMVTKQVEPDRDAWQRQEQRRRRNARNEKIGVFALVAAIALGIVFLATRAPSGPHSPAGGNTHTSTPPAVVGAQRAVVVSLDGSIRRTISVVPPLAYGLALSPNGATIAYVEAGSIGVVDIAGGTPQILTPASYTATEPVWSPDGREIAFSATRNGNQDLYLMNADGTNIRRLTTSPATDEWPSFSPDGTTVVYSNSGTRPLDDSGFSPTSRLYIVSAAGGRPTRVSSHDFAETQPSWSPDGTMIAYQADGEIAVMNADGTGSRAVSGQRAGGFTPRWSPDGSTIAFTRYDPSWRATSAMLGSVGSLPIVDVMVVDQMHTTTRVGRMQMITDYNVPVWVSNGELLVQQARRSVDG